MVTILNITTRMNTKMLEQLHCMMYSYMSDTVYENLGGDIDEEGGGRGGGVLSLSLSLSFLLPSLPSSCLYIWQNFGHFQVV